MCIFPHASMDVLHVLPMTELPWQEPSWLPPFLGKETPRNRPEKIHEMDDGIYG